MSTLLGISRLAGVKFAPYSTEDIKKDSLAHIFTPNMLKNNEPQPGGLLDGHLGPISYKQNCQTCELDKRKCVGHQGHLSLRYPIYNPLTFGEVKKWVRLICFKCGNPIVNEKDYIHASMKKRLDKASVSARTGNKSCPVCGTVHPSILIDQKNKYMLRYEEKDAPKPPEGKPRGEILYPHMIQQVLEKISDETVVKLGKPIESHPKHFILEAYVIPPVPMRPDVRKLGGSNISTGDITTLLQNMIKENEKIPPFAKHDVQNDEKVTKQIYDLIGLSQALARGQKSYADAIKGKKGLGRKNLLGKRTILNARNTITGVHTLQIDQVGIPLEFAKILQVEETVQEYNKDRLIINFLNGKSKYPGCSKIIKRNTGIEYSVDVLRSDMNLEIGDKIIRDLQDDDYVLFNRQPSLLPSNVSAMRAVINMNPDVITFTMNVIVCPLFNADFDGDQMNIFVITKEECVPEMKICSTIDNWFIKHAYGSPMLGQADDSIIGSFCITRSDIRFNKISAMRLFENTSLTPDFSHVSDPGSAEITGREMMSRALDDTPINLDKPTTYYQPGFAGYIDYNPDEIKLKIVNGEIKTGVLDKKNIGKNATEGVYHTIATQYGTKKAIEAIYNMQQIAINYLDQRGFTLGILDLIINKKSLNEIHKVVTSLVNKSELITEQLDKGEIITPINMTIEQYYEELQIANLRAMDDFAPFIFDSIDTNVNNLMQLILSGSKGSVNHIYHILAAITQMVINGARVPKKFSYWRTLPHFPTFCMSAASRGFIKNSYIAGMTTWETFFNQIGARFDLLTKALTTSVTGEYNRKSIKGMETIIVNNMRMTTKNNHVVQLLYGDDGLDSRKVIKVKFETIMSNDKQLEDGWHYRSKNSALQKVFDEEFARVSADRKRYRDIYLRLEKASPNDPISDKRGVSINILTEVNDMIHQYGEQTPSESEIADMVQRVKVFCDGLAYVLLNEVQEKRGMEIPEYMKAGVWMLCVLIRIELNSQRALRKLNMKILDMILNKIRQKHANALVDYGTAVGVIAAMSFAEPLVQYMIDAHHRTTTGGTSKNVMKVVREVLGTKSKEDLSAPTMILTLLPEYENEVKAQEVANNIEAMKLVDFLSMAQIFFEKFMEPVHPDYVAEKKMMEDFVKYNPLMRPPANLIKWCVRLTLNRTNMIYRNMSLRTIVVKLRDVFPNLYIIHTPENVPEIVIRIYPTSSQFKEYVNTEVMEKLRDKIINTIIRGIPDIKSAKVVKIARNLVQDDGSIKRTEKIAIRTEGSNIEDCMLIKEIDPYEIQTDAVAEIVDILGIRAARQRMVVSIRDLGAGGLDYHHVSLFVDEMSRKSGILTSIEKQGVSIREANNVLLRMGYSAPIQTLEEAVINALVDPIKGITSPLLVGAVPEIGTMYNKCIVDLDMMAKNTIRPDDFLNDLMQEAY